MTLPTGQAGKPVPHWLRQPGLAFGFLAVAIVIALELLIGGCDVIPQILPSTKSQTTAVASKVSDAINEVGELRSTVTNQIKHVQDSAWVWLIALMGISVLGAAFPVLLLLILGWLLKKWIARNSYIGQFEKIVELKKRNGG